MPLLRTIPSTHSFSDCILAKRRASMIPTLLVMAVTMGLDFSEGFAFADYDEWTAVEGSVMIVEKNNDDNRRQLEKIEVVVEFPPGLYKVTPIGITMSSSHSDHGPENCIDGVTDDLTNFCRTDDEGMENDRPARLPWLAVNIPRSIVQCVKIYNRIGDGDFADLTRNLNVWVTYQPPSTTRAEFNHGKLLASFPGPLPRNSSVVIDAEEGIDGTWVVFQLNNMNNTINLAEIEVYAVPGPDGE